KQRKSSEYKFTRVFDESATQSSIFEETCLPLLTPILRQDNYKALLFSHGATKSGKTHSIIGSPGQTGIIPRTLKVLFDSIAESSQDVSTPTQYRPFRVHDVEINSTDPKRPQLFLTTDNATHQKYIQDLREVNVRTLEEAMMVLRAGYRQRQLYATLTNRPSPRSHCIITIKVLKTPQFGESALKDAAKGKTSVSRLSIVDLAGSEIPRTMISSAGHGIKDSGHGDTSLIVLGHCLKVLRSNQVPFRQSKLTQLFQGSLEAGPPNSQVCLIANISPYRSKFDETTRTLEFAS
ncbi:P-loop containing nucleoside triphosphate hydrolase protein, partial [Linnemannia elongata]